MIKKKILFVTTVSHMVRAFLLPFADHFKARGWQVDVMSSNIALVPELSEHFDHLWNVDFSRNPLKIKNLFLLPQQIIEIIKKNNYDIVHVHSPVASFFCRFALQFIPKKHRPKVVYTAHGFHFHKNGGLFSNAAYYMLEKIAGHWTDRLITINVDDYVVAKKKKIVQRSQLVYMPGIGIDLDYYEKQRIAPEKVAHLRNSLNIKDNEYIFLMVAEFTKQKRQSLVVEAFADLAAHNAHLVLAGTGKCFDQVKNLIAMKNLVGKVHLLGFQRDIPTLIHASLATILVSNREGLPRAVLESLCLGTPVIGSNARGIKNLLHKGGGILVPQGNKKQLTAAMQYMLLNPGEAALMVGDANKRLKKHSQNNIIARHESLYKQLLEESKQ